MTFRTVLLAAVLSASVAAAFPQPQKYVSDGANLLDGNERSEINALLRGLEDDTTVEIAVVTVTSLDGMSVEEYANRLFKEWGIGKKVSSNGALVLVAPNERTMRIEVGYGLEPILPDGLAGEVIRTQFTPSFRSGDYAGGIRSGVVRLAEIVRAKHVVTAEERQAMANAAKGDLPPAWLMIPFFGAFIAIGAFMIGAGIRSKTFFPLLFGGLFGGIPFLMSLIPFFNATPWVLGPLALVCGIAGYRKGEGFADVVQPSGGRHSGSFAGSGWTFGSGSSGSSSSGESSSSSSSDSFGGGSSGGGGASGSW